MVPRPLCTTCRGLPSSLSQSDGRYQNETSVLIEEEVRRSTTMTIQEALNKANEGGYHIFGSDGMDTYYEGAHR
jgi:hypothetical protein